MSTRAQVRFATREEGVTFNEHPEKWNAQFYKHHDGYPEGLGLDIAKSLVDRESLRSSWEIEDLKTQHGDLEYIYSRSPWIVCNSSISHALPPGCVLFNIDSAISRPKPSG